MLIDANAVHIPLRDNSVDCVVTDPPYELGFMGKKWDSSGVAFQVETWKEVLRVMKPGAMMFCFGGPRTHHRLMCAIEDAGFEIRDCLMWLYGSGFPKSHDISKAIDKIKGRERKIVGKRKHPTLKNTSLIEEQASAAHGSNKWRREWDITTPATPEAYQWEGQGTALKPAYEPIILAMKPLDGTFAENALKWGVAGLNIDAGRIEGPEPHHNYGRTSGEKSFIGKEPISTTPSRGRWPANVILDEEAAAMLDEQSGELKSGHLKPSSRKKQNQVYGDFSQANINEFLANSGSASRFFYCAKASRSERNAGLEGMPSKQRDEGRKEGNPGGDNPRNRGVKKVQNYHPTVKPIALIEYLVKLGSRHSHIVLDPFVGSGTTCIACEKLNRISIGLDLSWEYLSEIAAKRLSQPIQKELKEDGN